MSKYTKKGPVVNDAARVLAAAFDPDIPDERDEMLARYSDYSSFHEEARQMFLAPDMTWKEKAVQFLIQYPRDEREARELFKTIWAKIFPNEPWPFQDPPPPPELGED